MNVVAIALACLMPLSTIQAATVSDINNDIRRNQATASALNAQSNTLKGQLTALNNQIANLSADISRNQQKAAQLKRDIEATRADLELKKQILGENIRTMYQQAQISPIEMLASSKNFSEYVERQQYLDRIKDHVQDAVAEVKNKQRMLEIQQQDLARSIQDQKIQQDSIAAKKAEQANLLAQTQGEESRYRGIVKSQIAERDRMLAAQAAAARRLTGGGATSGATGSFQFKNLSALMPCGSGGYTLCSGDPVDEWGLYKRQCVSYTAFAIERRFGRPVPHFGGQGHAYQWPSTLGSKGYTVNNTPAVGSVAIADKSNDLPYGHSMLVEQVYGNGWVKVSQYNFGYPGEMYSTMDVKASGVVFIHF